jgi:hypothetical protein
MSESGWNRKKLVKLVDTLRYELKFADKNDPMVEDFISRLDRFIKTWELDQDPHSFARLPE